MSENMNAQIILDAGAALGESRLPSEGAFPNDARVPYVVVPKDYDVKSLERLLPNPPAKSGIVNLLDVDSFIAYVNKHANDDTSVIYANVDYETSKYDVVAILDDHGAAVPMRRQHSAVLTPIQSLEWKRWHGNNKKAMPQADFAAFLEDNLGDIATVEGMPTGKDMLGMALAFEANSDKRFKKKVDLQGGGTHLEYVDQADEATATRLRYFERFVIGIPVFQGASEGYHVEARLKFRMNGGALLFWYELVRPDRVFKTAVSGEIDKIREATGLMVLFGRP